MLWGEIIPIGLGLMTRAQFSLSGPWAMGILLGIKLFFVGMIMVTGGSALHSRADA